MSTHQEQQSKRFRYEQQPYSQPPMQSTQPPSQQRRRWLWLIIGIVIIALISYIGISILVLHSNNVGFGIQSLGSGKTTQTPIPHLKVGQTVKVNATWEATLDDARTSQGQDYFTPRPGTIYLIIDVSLKNLSSSEQDVSSLAMFALKDSTGQRYTENITTFTNPPDYKIEAGEKLKATFAYEVPPTQHRFTFTFTPDQSLVGETIWDVDV